MIDGFKKFIARGDMIDMAVGVVMGAAVTAVVNSIVNNLINPLIAMIFGKPNMDGLLAFTFNGATVSFGAILSAVLNFLIVASAVYFCILVTINKPSLHYSGGAGWYAAWGVPSEADRCVVSLDRKPVHSGRL